MIRLSDVVKEYESGTTALKGISLRIEDGEFVFLVGPSGSGKSTIIKLLTGEIVPTSGQIAVNGFSLTNIAERQIPLLRRSVGVIFQDFRLIEKKTVYENLSFAMRAVGSSPREIKKRIPYVLELVGLEEKTDRYPNELSGGEQQRVAIARALINNPSTIIADEPTGNLDPARSLEIMRLLERINHLGTTMVVVTHEKDLVNQFKKRVVTLEQGVITSDGDGVGYNARYAMRKHDFSYFFGEGMRNMFSHGFMSFAAVGITVACLVVMGTFSLVAYNAQVQLQQLESEYEILAFVDESCDDAQTKAVGRAIEQRDNVKECVFISKEEAMKSFEARYEGDNMFQNLDPEILRDRYAVYVDDLSISGKTAQDILENVEGVANVRVDEDIAGGFITLRNVASVVCIALIAILLLVSVFIISNTIKLTTFDRRDEIAIMKMVGATNGFIRWPFVYEGFMIGLLSAVLGFGLQWLLYESVAKSLAMSDRLQLLTIVDFTSIWRPVAAIFAAAGILIGVGGSLTAIRKFLHV